MCDHAATTTGSLKQHKASKHEGVRYQCDACDYAAASVANLKSHKKIIHEDSLKFCLPLAKFILWDLNKRTSALFQDKDYILGKKL